MKIVLFDIDGTLLRTEGAGRRAMEHALHGAFGAKGDPAYRYDGKTDRQIVREQMQSAGIPDAEIDARLPTLLDRYAEHIEAELAANPALASRCAGIDPLLSRLRDAADAITLGLLTGNIARGARAKLQAIRLDFEQFRVNAFGCDHEVRAELPAIARGRAEALLGRAIAGEQLVIIGDTPADIACGRSLGVRAIAVATGRYSVDDLAQHAPAAVFPTLADTDAVVDAILA